jgi:hypothetical protein
MARASLHGQRDFFLSLDRNVTRIRREAASGLEAEVNDLYKAVLQVTPKKTGRLRLTSDHVGVRYPRGRLEGDIVRRIVFTTYYAPTVHQRLAARYTTPGTGRFYLINPMNERAFLILPAVARRMTQ